MRGRADGGGGYQTVLRRGALPSFGVRRRGADGVTLLLAWLTLLVSIAAVALTAWQIWGQSPESA